MSTFGLRSPLRIKRGGSWLGSAEMCPGVNGQKALALLTSRLSNGAHIQAARRYATPSAAPGRGINMAVFILNG